MAAINFKEFKPAIFLLLRFTVVYVIANLIYGWYCTWKTPQPDAVTRTVTQQVAMVTSAVGYSAHTEDDTSKPVTHLLYSGRRILTVFEGCNGVNVVIVFGSILFSFGSPTRKSGWFFLAGSAAIHLMNVARIVGLFFVSLYLPQTLYFVHKYLFTAIIYVFVFGLWAIWWRINHVSPSNETR